MIRIKKLTTGKELTNSVSIIQLSFKTVADDFNLTIDNCPSHPSFITYEKLSDLIKKGLIFLGLFIEDIQIGFIAIEKANDDLFYIEKLSILPHYRHKSYGRKLIDYAISYIKNVNGKKISIGIINEHEILKKWYNNIGFNETMTKHYTHLPFTVCFMEKKL
jgi:GNAT superfamily N-acetyltransferase